MRLRFTRLTALALTLSVIAACSVAPLVFDDTARAPVLDGFGDGATLVPSQANSPARQLFAEGMKQVYAFNEVEAVRYFKAALAQDRDCGLCAWGVAYRMGPNINSPTRGDLSKALPYVDYALKHSEGASPRDRALIEAMALRYRHPSTRAIAPLPDEMCAASGGSGKRDPLDIAYAERMRDIAARYPGDADVLLLYVESEMIATSEDWWDISTGKPYGRIGELADRVEAALAINPNHVGLNHYMIHAVDAVPVAGRAVAAADRLGSLAPKSPHLLHMPAHTYANVGRYADAARVNQQAVDADVVLAAEQVRQKFSVSKDWRGHNRHFLWFASLMEGRAELSLKTARESASAARSDSEFSEYIRSLPMLTLLHLKRWDALLKEPMPAGDKGMALVLGEMSRGIALAHLGRLAEAKAALARLEPAADKLLKKSAGQNRSSKYTRGIAGSAPGQLRAEIAFAEQRIDDAIAQQAQAVAAGAPTEENEPPPLASGPRQRLGDLQMRARRYAAAETTFREDLVARPNSGWALNGLEKALLAQGKHAEAKAVLADLDRNWAQADREVRQ
jgi:tetratricopeptide (TPR) repeat protein